jgi:DNA helicase-2/ATP-dependent DNA helicase PcrA
LALLPQSENTDDALRLLFVALTRAKTHLYLNTYQYGKDSKEMQVLSFLADLVEFEECTYDSMEVDADQKQDLNNVNSPLIVWFEAALSQVSPDFNLKDYLRYSLENYKLSVTHLNNFLDLVRGGPKRFLEQNLLRFPQAKSPNAAYGTSMHAAITDFYTEFKRVGFLPESEVLIEKFEISLKSQRLNQQDTLSFLKKGVENLRLYHQDQKSNFNLSDRLEEDFASQGVVLFKCKDDLNQGIESLNEAARITGKIDKLKFNTLGDGNGVKIIEVVDFKTGKNHSKWSDSTLDVQVKLQNYRRQLVFYKLLVENSRDFGKYTVNTGSLEFLDLPKGQDKIVILNTEIGDQEAVELSKLIQVVYKKIINLDFPDISKYEPNLKGIEEFIQDLIAEF